MMYGLTLSLKNEIVKIAPKGRVNCIGPGWVRTPMAVEALANSRVIYSALATCVISFFCLSRNGKQTHRSTPLKKVAEPTDIAQQIVILSSTKVSGHVSGQVLMIEGGMEGRLLNMPADLGLPSDL